MIRMESEISTVDRSLIRSLKEIASDTAKKRSRLIVGREDSPVQEMFIVLGKDSYVRPHRHPKDKPESYFVIEGELDVLLFKEDGSEHRTIRLSKETPFYRMKGGWFHQPVAVTEWCVYKETYAGPFVKESDVEYAAWAAEEK